MFRTSGPWCQGSAHSQKVVFSFGVRLGGGYSVAISQYGQLPLGFEWLNGRNKPNPTLRARPKRRRLAVFKAEVADCFMVANH
jgi:hypothetical protein